MTDSILHLTLNTGHSHTSPRSEIFECTIDALMTIIEHGGGPLAPYLPGYAVAISKADSGWIFHIQNPDGVPLVICGVAADKPSADKLWPQFSRPMMPVPLMPPSFEISQPTHLPWVAVQILAPDASFDDFYKIGSFERFLAWALIEHPEK